MNPRFSYFVAPYESKWLIFRIFATDKRASVFLTCTDEGNAEHVSRLLNDDEARRAGETAQDMGT